MGAEKEYKEGKIKNALTDIRKINVKGKQNKSGTRSRRITLKKYIGRFYLGNRRRIKKR